MSFVLHVVPDSVANTRKPFVGSTKDVRGRAEYFQSHGIAFREFLSEGRSDGELLSYLRSADLSDCTAVVIEYETYIESLRWLRDEYPHILRVVRAHNANFQHQIDNFVGRTRMGSPEQQAEDLSKALARFAQDVECAQLADVLLPISDWEAEHYWSALSARNRVVTLPYFLPASFEVQPTPVKRGKLCVCFMGSGGQMTPLLYDLGRNTLDAVAEAGDALTDWDFAITGSIKPKDVLGPLGRVRPTGLLQSPFQILREARAILLLSDLGMGFKTKILEAIVAGCWVVVTPDVLRRLPMEVLPWCKAVKVGDGAGFVGTIRQCEMPPPAGNPNAALRARAFAALDAALVRRAEPLASASISASAST